MIRLYYTATQDWMFGPYDYVIYDTERGKCEGVTTDLLFGPYFDNIIHEWFTPTDTIPYVEAPTLTDILSSYPELFI